MSLNAVLALLGDKERNVQKLVDLIEPLSKQDFAQLFNDVGSSGETIPFVSTILQGSPADSEGGLKRRANLFKLSLKRTTEIDCSDKTCSQLVTLWMPELDSLSEAALVDGVHICVEAIKTGDCGNGSVFEFLPKLLFLLAACETISINRTTGPERYTGIEFKELILQRIIAHKWPMNMVVRMATVLREVELSPDQADNIIRKIFKQMTDLDFQELPPLIYQVLLFARAGLEGIILQGIIDHFNRLDDQCNSGHSGRAKDVEAISEAGLSEERLRQIEGSVLLHINFAMKQQQTLGKEFLKLVKNSGSVALTPFALSLLLSLSGIQRYEDKVIDLVKSMVVQRYRDEDRIRSAPWIAALTPMHQNTGLSTSLLGVFQTVNAHASFGWETVTQANVTVAVALIDANIPKFFEKDKEVDPRAPPQTPLEHACSLGVSMLREAFKMHEMVRADILDHIFSRIITKSPAAPHFVGVLHHIIRECPQPLLEHLPKLKDAVDYLSFLSVSMAELLLDAVRPVVTLNASFHDHVVLVLRKAMFAKSVEGRIVALLGFVRLLYPDEESAMSFSQRHFSQDPVTTSRTSMSNFASPLEILGNLRRCLSQQYEVRLRLYQNIISVMSVNPALAQPIVELLQPQLVKYIGSSAEEGGIPAAPLLLDACLLMLPSAKETEDLMKPVEPLPFLLSAVLACLLHLRQSSSNSEAGSSSGGQLVASMRSLSRRLSCCEPEEYDLDKNADFTTGSSQGTRNMFVSTVLVGCYTAMMEFVLQIDSFSKESCELALQLHTKLQAIIALLLKDSSATKLKKNRFSELHHVLTLETLATWLRFLYGDQQPAHFAAQEILRGDKSFCHFVISSACAKIIETASKDQRTQETAYRHIITISRVLFGHLIVPNFGALGGDQSKVKVVVGSALDCLNQAYLLVQTSFPAKLISFVTTINPTIVESAEKAMKKSSSKSSSSDSKDELLLYYHAEHYQGLVERFLSERQPNYKEAAAALAINSTLSTPLIPFKPTHEKVKLWLKKVCEEQNPDDLTLCKALINSFLSFLKSDDDCKMMFVLAEDIHKLLGDCTETEDDREPTVQYTIVNRKTSTIVISQLLSLLEHELDEMEWVILAKLTKSSKNQDEDKESEAGDDGDDLTNPIADAAQWETALCQRLLILCDTLVLLSRTASTGMNIEHVLKVDVKFYHMMVNFVKAKIADGQLLQTLFLNVIEKVTSSLTDAVYAYLPYVGKQDQEAAAKEKKGKGKGKAKVVSRTTREARLIPKLIYEIEVLERRLLQLSKARKTNLMRHAKRSTARDFRIQHHELDMAIEKAQEQDDEPYKEKEKPKRRSTEDDGSSTPKRSKGAGAKKKARDSADDGENGDGASTTTKRRRS